MKTGMNLLLWTDHVTEAQDPIIDQIKALGFDAVEIPIFNTSDLALTPGWASGSQSLGLGATAVTVMGADYNPISPDPKIRDAAVAHLDRVMECGQQFGCEILCGPAPLGHRRLLRHGADRGRIQVRRRDPAAGRGEGPGAGHQAGRRVPEPVRVLLPDHGRPDRSLRPGRESSLLQDDVRQLPRPHRGEEPGRAPSSRARRKRSTFMSPRTTGALPAPDRSTGVRSSAA